MDGKVRDKLVGFDRELTEEGIGIYGRSYIATATLLAYCSPLRFVFGNRLLPRGWLDILIVGDTRCGKSAIVESIVRGMKLGEFCKCENTSFAGLIGGLHQLSSRAKWDIVWGKIPLNNGKLLALDEMSSLSTDDIGNMSAVRSSGVAEVTKIQSGQTGAATRLIWISNPREGQHMAEFSSGVHVVKQLIGRPEDISRFDFCIAVASTDISIDVVNQNRPPSNYQGKWDELRNLVLWIWQLRPHDVIFDNVATEAILSHAKSMAMKYDPAIPLVEPNEQRVRIARVAAATAGRCFSEEGGKLVVKKEHVEFAAWFMQRCFDSRPMGYDRFSDNELTKRNGEDKKADPEVVDVIKKYTKDDKRMMRLLLENATFSTSDLENFLNVCRPEAREITSVLMKYGCIAKRKHGFVKTKAGVDALKEMLG